MNLIEKRAFIQSHLNEADEEIIEEFYEILRKEAVLKGKLTNRALKSEDDIANGSVVSRSEIEHQTNISFNK